MPRSARDSTSTGFFLAAMMPLKDGYLASPVRSVTLTRAGNVATYVSVAVSVSRSISTVSPVTLTRPA
jgi:hypothetical protein